LKHRELERHLAPYGCAVLREGTNHTIWHNPPADVRTPVPDTGKPTGTVRAICRQLTSRSALNRPARMTFRTGIQKWDSRLGNGCRAVATRVLLRCLEAASF
jgi:mRNA interferase HicA